MEDYTFVTRSEEIDPIRVVKEAPAGTPFILMEESTRKGHPVRWTLFVSNNVLSDPDLFGRLLGLKKAVWRDRTCHEFWGWDQVSYENEEAKPLYSYRALSGTGKFPGYIKQQIEAIRRALNLNPKNAKVKVTYL